MMDDCRNCPTGNVVPVLDVSMTNRAKGGNPYRTRCLRCGFWNKMTSKEAWKNHHHPHVLPRDADPDSDDSTIPLEDWDDAKQFQDVLDRLERLRSNQGGQEADDDPDQEQMNSESAEEIRQQHRGETTDTQSAPDDDGDGDGGDGGQTVAGIGLPTPQINKRHLAIIAAIVVAVVLWRLYRAKQSDGDESVQVEAQSGDESEDGVDRDGEDLEVPTNDPDPLAGDEAVTEQFRNRGVIGSPEAEG